ncbi:MAG: hypothetical protein JXL97_09800 [Bacteroidales bacterium]|nr:hypothetical protein [Bacteroidales bacterium]
MIKKLQKKSINANAIIFSFTLFVGLAILLIISQLYFDIKPLIKSDSDIFKKQTVAISKQVSAFKSVGKSEIGFEQDEIEEIRNQDFVKSIAEFKTANFEISAYTESDLIPDFYTLLFLESIPNDYLDVEPEEWTWSEGEEFLPIVVPGFYLTLYNFGFAQSQGLPVISENMLSQFDFKIRIKGQSKVEEFDSRIVGFSNKINSILVPEEFMNWANAKYGSNQNPKPTRLLLEFNDPSDERILQFFNDNNYDISAQDLQLNKVMFYFKSASAFVFFIGLVITVLSVSLIVLSLFLIFYKNKEEIINLSLLGYTNKQISVFYNVIVSVITFVSIIAAFFVSLYVRSIYVANFETFVGYDKPDFSVLFPLSITFSIILLLLNNFIIFRRIKKITEPRN